MISALAAGFLSASAPLAFCGPVVVQGVVGAGNEKSGLVSAKGVFFTGIAGDNGSCLAVFRIQGLRAETYLRTAHSLVLLVVPPQTCSEPPWRFLGTLDELSFC